MEETIKVFIEINNNTTIRYDGKYIERQKYPIISLIIPCHEKGIYLPRSFKSVIEDQHLQQHSINLEIIGIDDSSKDNTTKIFKKLKAKYEPEEYNKSTNIYLFKNNCHIKLYRFSKNKGTLYGRLFGINQTRSRYVMSIDADDEMIPGFFELLLKILKEKPEIDIIQYRMAVVLENHEMKRIAKKKKGKNVNFLYKLFSYGKYPFNITHEISFNSSIYEAKYDLRNNLSDRKLRMHFIDRKQLRQMVINSSLMWNLPAMILRRSLIIKAVNALNINPNYKKVSVYEDRLICYACFYFCNNFCFLDEIGYIYHREIRTKIRRNRAPYVNSILNKLFASGLNDI